MEIRDFEEDKEKDEHSRSGQDEHRPACRQAGNTEGRLPAGRQGGTQRKDF